jgi:metal-responsive CopG/Arc/MetJ family transcriptional regulator
MKVKTSVTLSDNLLKEVDKLLGKSGNRSVFIENALEYYLEMKRRKKRDKKDLDLINKNHTSLNKEAEDVLEYQVNL